LTTTNRTRPGGAFRRESPYEKSRATTRTTTGAFGLRFGLVACDQLAADA
jgi:hypothetical protein